LLRKWQRKPFDNKFTEQIRGVPVLQTKNIFGYSDVNKTQRMITSYDQLHTSEFVNVNGTLHIYFNGVFVIYFGIDTQIHSLSVLLVYTG
jgi:hypothetical protein